MEFYYAGHWSPAYNVNWGTNEAAVVCREMNCGDPAKVSGSFGQSGAVRGYKASCNGRENSLTDCTLREYTRGTRDGITEAAVDCSGET